MPSDRRGPASAVRRLIAVLIALAAAWALLVAITGGLDLRPYGIPFRSTDPDRPSAAAVVLVVVYALLFRRAAIEHTTRLSQRLAPLAAVAERRSAALAASAAAVIVVLGMVYGLHVAAGSDSWGYVSQSRLWLRGDLMTEQPVATRVPWPEADWTFAPLGYRPAQQPGAIVPVYAAGLPILMALATVIVGACGPYVVVPLLGGLTVWLTYWVGARLWTRLAGLASALLLATSPTFLFMLMNPMSDVPAAAFFLAAFAAPFTSWRTRAAWSGAAASAAIAIRPNLLPVGAVFLLLAVARSAGRRWNAAAAFCAAGLPLMLLVAWVHTRLYGAPWRAGYGALDQFYAWSHLPQNVVQYSKWLFDTETFFVALLFVPVVLIRRLDAQRRLGVAFAAAFAGAIWLCYLFYAPYDVWWYLRFLLPAFPVMLMLAAIGCACLVRRFVPPRLALAAAFVVAVPVMTLRIAHIREQALLSLWQGGVVYVSAAEYVANHLPQNAVLLTVQHSGSIRHYTGRLTLRWDLLRGDWWPRALDVLVEQGYRPYLLISSFEEQQLRRQFGLSPAIDAPGTVIAEMTAPEAIRIYDPLRKPAGATATIPQVIPCICGSER